MFTGIITAIGTVRSATPGEGGLALELSAPWDDLVPGESVAVDGACLTVERLLPGGFAVHLVPTTLERTRFGGRPAGSRVNLERALRAGDRLGGHLVQGHVDGVGIVRANGPDHGSWLMEVAVPPAVAGASIPLGSVTVDGVSLTIHAIPGPGLIQVSLVPFTLQHTTLGDLRPGDPVHLEGDAVGKYLRALAAPHLGTKAD